MSKYITIIAVLVITSVKFSHGQGNRTPSTEVRNSPDWVTQGIIYQIQPRAFSQEGTIKAIIPRLSEIKRLGVTIIYLCPVFVMDKDNDQRTWSPRQKASGMDNPGNPYKIKDYFHVDSEFGNDQELKELVDSVHAKGLKIILDMVYLHCGKNADFLKDNYGFVKRNKDGEVVLNHYNWPELNYDNPTLREFIYSNMAYWISAFDVDGFRCDVAGGIPLDFWEWCRGRLQVLKSEIMMLAESERMRDQNRAFDVDYGFTWLKAISTVMNKNSSAFTIRQVWEKLKSDRPIGYRFLRYTDNHDISNDAWYNTNEDRWGIEGMNAAFVLNFTIDGVPFIYNGQEIANKSRTSIFGNLPIHWSLWNTAEGKERFRFLQELIQLRKRELMFAKGDLNWIENNQKESVVSFQRSYKGKNIVVIINLKPDGTELKLNSKGTNSNYEVLLSSRGIKGNLKEGFKMNGYDYWVGVGL